MSARQDIDWVAEMFRALRDCGEDISIVFGRVDAGQDVAWQTLPHDQFDGVSGLAALLRQQQLSPGTLPVLREGWPSRWRRTRGVLSVLRYLGVRHQQWTVDYDWQDPAGFAPVSERVAWTLFDGAQTQALIRAAKAAGVTVNTFLLSHLDAAVGGGRWVPAGAPRRWMLPVNMRGAVPKSEDAQPKMSFLPIDGTDGLPVAELQAQIDHNQKIGRHWGMWSLLQLGRLLGEEGMRKDIRKRERQRHGVTGMFSNLGVWNVDGAGHWIFCPAITRVYPIGAGCITVNGRLALTLQLHHALGGTLEKSRATLDAWVQGCLAAAASHEAPHEVAVPRSASPLASA